MRTELQRAKDKYAATRQELIEVTEGKALKDTGMRCLYTEIEKLKLPLEERLNTFQAVISWGLYHSDPVFVIDAVRWIWWT